MIVAPPEWRSYGETIHSGEHEIHRTIIEQPLFHTQSLSTSMALESGQLVLAGGGMPSRQSEKMVQGGFGFHAVVGNLLEWIQELDIEALREDAGIE